MKNLIKQTEKSFKLNRMQFITGLKGLKEISEILNTWRYSDLIPVSSKKRNWANIKELKDYIIKRYDLKYTKQLNKEIERINTVFNSQDVDSIKISVEWKKSAMWGNNPSAEIRVYYKDGSSDNFCSGSIGGCGYDKECTAVANCLNQCNGLLKPMYIKKNSKIKVDNRELFGYGSGYGLRPYFEGGVGTSCYYKILESIKGKFQKIASGKTYDVYTITF